MLKIAFTETYQVSIFLSMPQFILLDQLTAGSSP